MIPARAIDLAPQSVRPSNPLGTATVVMSNRRIASLSRAERIWAVAAVHGEVEQLVCLHDAIWPRLEHGDRIVYLGNLIGWGKAIPATLDELLDFRRAVMARDGGFACDLTYLRGSQEVMWHKLLQLQFTPDPSGALSWMLQRGVAATLESYGCDKDEGLRAARGGTVALTRWTGQVRQAMKRHAGHEELLGRLHSAADTGSGGVLFLNAGLDPKIPVDRQGDLFWWHGVGFSQLDRPYAGYRRVVRGFDPRRRGGEELPHKITLDSGAGFGGPLTAACITPDGDVVERLEV